MFFPVQTQKTHASPTDVPQGAGEGISVSSLHPSIRALLPSPSPLPPSSPGLSSPLLPFSPYAIEGLHIGHPGFLYEPFTIQLRAFFFSPFDMQRNLLILFAALMVRLHQRLGCSEGCRCCRGLDSFCHCPLNNSASASP